MKQLGFWWFLPLLTAVLVMGCPDDIDDGAGDNTGYTGPDDRVTLAASADVNAAVTDISAAVTFTGATGLALAKRDFTVTGGGAVDSVTVEGDTARVTVNLAANTTAAPKTYTVGISPTSPRINGNAKVTITQPVRVTLSAGADVEAAVNTLYATVTFTGADGLTLGKGDFTILPEGTIYSVSVAGDTASVIVNITPNTETGPKIYTIGASEESMVIRSDNAVTITQGVKKTLAAGPAVSNVAAAAVTAVVTFTGAAGLTLGANDFTVTGTGTYIGAITVSGDTASVTATIGANTTTSSRTFTVGISAASPRITGSGTVTITQVAKPTLTAGSAVSGIAAAATTATVTFTGAAGLALVNSDFTVTGTGTSISNVSVNGGTATVTVTFPANTNPIIPRNYVVGISASSPTVGGTGTVTISQVAAGGAGGPSSYFFEDFEKTNASDLPWTLTTGTNGGSGGISQTLDNGTGLYRGFGTGVRGLALNFKTANVITGNKLYVDFDWMPIGTASFTGQGPAYLSINTNSGLYSGNKIITFIVRRVSNTSHQLWYRNDSFTTTLTTGAAPESPAVQLNGFPTSFVNLWLTVKTVIDFTAGTVSFTITNRTSGATLATVNNLALNSSVTGANRVGAFRLENSRPDGTDTAGWVPVLDNVYVANGPMPQ